ncbi:unnamed protein product [Chrysoparadoxa australica]
MDEEAKVAEDERSKGDQQKPMHDRDRSFSEAVGAIPQLGNPLGPDPEESRARMSAWKRYTSGRGQRKVERWNSALAQSGGLPGKGITGANIFDILTFRWMNPLVDLATAKTLEFKNVWKAPASSDCDSLVERFDVVWNAPRKPGKTRHLGWTMLKMFQSDVLKSGVLAFIQQFAMLLVPLLVQQLLKWFSDPEAETWLGYAIAIGIVMVGVIGAGLVASQMFFMLYKMGMDFRTTFNALVYRKSLRLSNKARMQTSTGEAVTLMSNDAQRMPDMMFALHQVWTAPLFIIVTLYFLIDLVGYAALGGIAFLAITMPTQVVIAGKQMGVQRKLMTGTDSRIKLVNEILQGIKIVKYYAWEMSFKDRLDGLRNVELGFIRNFAILNALSMTMLMITPFGMVLITMILFFNGPGNFSPDVVFTAVSLLMVVRFPLFMLPMTIANAVQARISLARLTKYLELEELKPEDRTWMNRGGTGKGCGSISVKGGVFSWSSADPEGLELPGKQGGSSYLRRADQALLTKATAVAGQEDNKEPSTPIDAPEDPFTLEVTGLDVVPGELLAVVGQVGSGKSSLVQAMLGEMTRKEGTVVVDGSIAYVAQSAWIINATLRDNILMGLPMDQTRYNKVLKACQLQQDMEILPGGDMCEIGEKGINLSGGQKQRVSLARAAYSDADIYIMDDPLSAVDAHVGKHIFEKCIKQFLADRTRILCANQLQFLPECNRVAVIRAGTIQELGTYNELMGKQGEMAKLMTTYAGGEEEAQEPNGLEAPVSVERARSISRAQSDVQVPKKGVVGLPPGGSSLVQDETMEEGKVELEVFHTYFVRGSGGWALPIWLGIITICSQGSSNVFEYWLSLWSQAYLENPDDVGDFYMYVYSALAVVVLICYLTRALSFAQQAILTSRHLHELLVKGILRAPMTFFDTTPIGRILNRFSKDMDAIDLLLPRNIPMFFQTTVNLVGVLLTISIILPWFLIPMLPIMFVYYLAQRYYRPVSRSLQRLESTSRSPIFAQFSETLAGVATLRAYNQEKNFVQQNTNRIDASNRAFFHMHCANRWLQFRLELLGNGLIFAAAFLVVLGKSVEAINITAGVAGLVLTYTQQITGTLNWAVRMGCETEARITSAERIKEYAEIKPEAEPRIPKELPKGKWPTDGAIEIKNLSLRYRPELDLVLRDVTLSIKGGEKIGIAGRTGSGKSSLMVALFRIVEPCEGTIMLDGTNILKMGLTDLREQLSIIPQDPVCFQGTMRQNLDPFDKYDDQTLWDVLRASHLYDYVSSLEEKLEAPVSEGGENMSVGQRQLLCLARAILRRTKILVMDEATANIDIDTDALIQKTIRKEFAHCTVLTIAHRLNTILDSDKILVMHHGKVAEFDTPANLVSKKSRLLDFINDTGAQSSKRLIDIAQSSGAARALTEVSLAEESGEDEQEQA